MTTCALIHGAGDVGWYWHLVERELRNRGHRTVAPDLPIENDEATLLDQARVVVDALRSVHDGGELVIVGHSWGGYVAPIVAELAKADRLVLVAPEADASSSSSRDGSSNDRCAPRRPPGPTPRAQFQRHDPVHAHGRDDPLRPGTHRSARLIPVETDYR